MSLLAWILDAVIVGGLIFALGMVIANLCCFDGLLPTGHFGADAPRVSILVPARNEAHNIEKCVQSLLAQDYPNFELFVLDDHSEDDTSQIVRGLGLSESGDLHRLIQAPPLPEGWTGKAWACHQLSLRARGEYLFFTDADTEHAPGTVSAAVTYSRRHRAGLVSAWPRLVTHTWGERLIIPIILLVGMSLYPHWLVYLLQHRPKLARFFPDKLRRLLGAANGQFMFFTRKCYEEIGGHSAVADHMVEDLALGRAVAARMHLGTRLVNCDALQFSTCRMYRSFQEVWDGFTKNARAAFEQSVEAFLIMGAFLFWCFLWPCLALFLPIPGKGLVITAVLLICIIRVLLTVRFKTAWLSAILHPFGVAMGLGIGLYSWWRILNGGVSWKGRTYSGITVEEIPVTETEPPAHSEARS